MNAKLESVNSFRLNNSKITVCTKLSIHTVILVIILPRDLAPLFRRPNLEKDPLLAYLLHVIFFHWIQQDKEVTTSKQVNFFARLFSYLTDWYVSKFDQEPKK